MGNKQSYGMNGDPNLSRVIDDEFCDMRTVSNTKDDVPQYPNPPSDIPEYPNPPSDIPQYSNPASDIPEYSNPPSQPRGGGLSRGRKVVASRGTNVTPAKMGGEHSSKSSSSKSNQSKLNQSKSSSAKSNQSKSNQSKSSSAKSNQSKLNQSKSSSGKSNQSKSNQSKSNSAKSNQSKSNQSKSSSTKSNQSKSSSARSAHDKHGNHQPSDVPVNVGRKSFRENVEWVDTQPDYDGVDLSDVDHDYTGTPNVHAAHRYVVNPNPDGSVDQSDERYGVLRTESDITNPQAAFDQQDGYMYSNDSPENGSNFDEADEPLDETLELRYQDPDEDDDASTDPTIVYEYENGNPMLHRQPDEEFSNGDMTPIAEDYYDENDDWDDDEMTNAAAQQSLERLDVGPWFSPYLNGQEPKDNQTASNYSEGGLDSEKVGISNNGEYEWDNRSSLTKGTTLNAGKLPEKDATGHHATNGNGNVHGGKPVDGKLDSEMGGSRGSKKEGVGEACISCLSHVPCASLITWIILLMGLGGLTGGVIYGVQKTRDIVKDEYLLLYAEYVMAGICASMFLFGTFFLCLCHASSDPTSRRVFNTSAKNICARGLNLAVLIVVYILLLIWSLILSVLSLPLVSFAVTLYIKNHQEQCIDLNYYGINHQVCSFDIDYFKLRGRDAFVSYAVAYVGCIFIIMSLANSLICISTNLNHLRDTRFALLNPYDDRNDEMHNSKQSILETVM